ncbi:MAG: alpha/beta hydrolase [Oscillochloris sp.]|nr:alpha/beta hydrolase [Oscillochloris sp.]
MSDHTAQTAVVDEMLVPVGEYRLRVPTAGAGPAVLLLHGFLVDADDWLPTIVYLADAGFRVIAPDALGFGHSDKPGGATYNLGTYADLNAGLLQALRALSADRSRAAVQRIAAALSERLNRTNEAVG